MFLASAEIHYKEDWTPRSLPTLVLHPILHPFPIVRSPLSPVLVLVLNSSTGAYFALLPTPSPELLHSPVHPHSAHEIYLQNQPAWEDARPEPIIGSKRSHDYNVDDFFTDMKKRRVNPSYDSREQSSILFPNTSVECFSD